MREKKLTQNEQVKIAQILESTNASSMDFIGMMIDLHTLGIDPKNHYWYWGECIKPQIKSVLYSDRTDGTKYPKFSAYINERVERFAFDTIYPWFEKGYKRAYELLENELPSAWDLEFRHGYEDFNGYLTDFLMEALDTEDYDAFGYGLDIFTDYEDCGCEEEETLTEETK